MSIIQYAVLNDIHFPYESKAYYKALKKIEGFPKLKCIFLNGDIAEIESVSTHPKTPAAQSSLLKELDYINEKFDELEKRFPSILVCMIEGNHCYRIFRFIRDVAPSLWGMVETPKLFRFEERNWHFVPYGPNQWQKCGKTNLWLRHEPLVMGMNCAKLTAEKSTVNILFGHTHTYAQYSHKRNGPEPQIVTATSGGWLGDINRDCFDYRGNKDNWRLMFTRIDCDEDTGEYELRPVFF